MDGYTLGFFFLSAHFHLMPPKGVDGVDRATGKAVDGGKSEAVAAALLLWEPLRRELDRVFNTLEQLSVEHLPEALDALRALAQQYKVLSLLNGFCTSSKAHVLETGSIPTSSMASIKDNWDTVVKCMLIRDATAESVQQVVAAAQEWLKAQEDKKLLVTESQRTHLMQVARVTIGEAHESFPLPQFHLRLAFDLRLQGHVDELLQAVKMSVFVPALLRWIATVSEAELLQAMLSCLEQQQAAETLVDERTELARWGASFVDQPEKGLRCPGKSKTLAVRVTGVQGMPRVLLEKFLRDVLSADLERWQVNFHFVEVQVDKSVWETVANGRQWFTRQWGQRALKVSLPPGVVPY